MASQVNIFYSHDALQQLKKLEKTIAKRIVLKVANNASQTDPLSRAKPLHGRLSGKYRYRIGEYRAIFTLDERGTVTVLMVLAVTHRRDVYR